ncbi:MAG: hypothetical protein ACFFB5_16195 [Promethearchaeota archaeon]
MSIWQSFFNQLSKPINRNDTLSISSNICNCEEGSLAFYKNNYHPQGDCSLSLVCCAIQIDKHRAYTFNNNYTVSKKPEIPLSEKSSSKLFPLDTFLDRL